MKPDSTRLARRYTAALGKYLEQGPRASFAAALRLGRQTVAAGLETLDLARIHEQALAPLLLPGSLSRVKATITRRAGIFFAEANAPIEETHREALRTRAHLSRLEESLGKRTRELAASNRQREVGAARHRAAEDALEKSGKRHKKCLEESLRLQRRLRQLTHRLLAAQESERQKISHELHDEISQTLLAINVRLLSLRREAHSNLKGLKDGIANTQRTVVESARSMRLGGGGLQSHETQAFQVPRPVGGRASEVPEARQPGKPGTGRGRSGTR